MIRHDVYGHIIEIWEPRYKDDNVLIGRQHVMDGTNYITFTRAPHLEDKVYAINGDVIRSYRLQSNGRGEVYCVPMKKLKLVGYLSDTKAPVIQVTNEIIANHLKKQGFTILECDADNQPVYVQGKRNNILATVTTDSIFFDKVVKNGRTFGFEEIDYRLSWTKLEDIVLNNIPQEIIPEVTPAMGNSQYAIEHNEGAETETATPASPTINPLLI